MTDAEEIERTLMAWETLFPVRAAAVEERPQDAITVDAPNFAAAVSAIETAIRAGVNFTNQQGLHTIPRMVWGERLNCAEDGSVRCAVWYEECPSAELAAWTTRGPVGIFTKENYLG